MLGHPAQGSKALTEHMSATGAHCGHRNCLLKNNSASFSRVLTHPLKQKKKHETYWPVSDYVSRSNLQEQKEQKLQRYTKNLTIGMCL